MDSKELLDLFAVSGDFFVHYFFPKTFRTVSPEWMDQGWRLMDSVDPEYEQVALEVYRGGAKTTFIRGWLAKSVSFAFTNCTFLISLSQRHSIFSLRWLRRQIEGNRLWTDFFQLVPGDKWTDEHLEIKNQLYGQSIHLLSLGITGQSRGINIDDYRPDTLVLDDVCDIENTKTKDQRDKTDDYVYGTLIPGMAAPSDCARKKVAALQTCIMSEDFISKCHLDKSWYTIKMSALTDESSEGGQRSTWEARYPTPYLLKKKQQYTARGQLFFWLREYECRLVSRDNAVFLTENLKYYEDWDLPAIYLVFGGIDPARKKSDKPHKSAIVKIAIAPPKIFLREYYVEKKKDPEELWVEFLRMFSPSPRPTRIQVETIAYQQILAWYFRRRMHEVGRYFVITEKEGDTRSKDQRIRDVLSGVIANGEFYVKAGQTEAISALQLYTGEEDVDLLDGIAQAVEAATPFLRTRLPLVGTAEEVENEDDIEALPQVRHCP